MGILIYIIFNAIQCRYRSTWPARQKVDRSTPQSVWTLSVDWSLFWALVTKLNYFTANALFLEVHLTQCKIYIYYQWKYILLLTGLLIFHEKKSKISPDFLGQIRGKIGRFRGIFAGEKSKFAEQSADFGRFSREKSQNWQKNQPISRDFSEKKVNFRRIFRGKFLGESADFTENFGGKLRQETISKKQPISLGFFFGKFR